MELESRRRLGKDMIVKELPLTKIRHPLTMEEDLDKQVQAYITDLGKVGGGVNKDLVIASARGIIRKKDSGLLAKNGRPFALTNDSAYHLLVHIRYVKRKASSKMKIAVENFEEYRINFLCSIKGIVTMEEIPSSLILNWDHTGLKYVPVSTWTMAQKRYP